MAKKFYLTTPIYYVNDKPHIGHAYTTIATDVLARYYRQQFGKSSCFFLTGTDEHGAKVAESAKKAGLSPQKFCDKYSQSYKEAWKNLNISNDYFIRTTDEKHKITVEKFMQKLYDQGDIYEGEYQGLYCIGCEKFLTEKDLINGMCPYHKDPPKKITEKNYFFKLKKYLPQVKKLIEQDEVIILPEKIKKEVMGLFKQGLDDFSVSREKVEWGIPLPFDKKQKTYVWVEALQNYISAVGYGDDKTQFKQRWQSSQVIHLMAKDIIKFHAIYWPALLLAADLELPKVIFAHGFFTIDSKKMSKSLGNVIDSNELVKIYGVDATRYLLLAQFPFGQDGDIKSENFTEKYNSDLANGLGNAVNRVSNLVQQSKVKIKNNKSNNTKLKKEVDKLMKSYSFDSVLNLLWKELSKVDKIINDKQPWVLAKEGKKKELEEVLTQSVQSILNVAYYLEPFLPQTSEKIIKQFTAPTIKKEEALFPRL